MKYNPFKMLGAWVGSSISFLLSLIFFLVAHIYPQSHSRFLEEALSCMFLFQQCHVFEMFIPIILYSSILVGFLIGWGIHSLVRYIKEKKTNNPPSTNLGNYCKAHPEDKKCIRR